MCAVVYWYYHSQEKRKTLYQPLADRIRPQTLDDVVGQRALLAQGALLRRIIDSGNIPNMIFYGPSGVGKTHGRGYIARQTAQAVPAQRDDCVYQRHQGNHRRADTFFVPEGALLYLDEIQYFNKSSSRACLSSSRTDASRSSPPRPKTPIFTFTTRF